LPLAPGHLLADMSQPLIAGTATSPSLIAGKYQLVAKLGEGGMAEVWEATNIDLDSPVALKLCRPEVAHATSLATRLLREAKAVARLTHPNIVRVYDAGLTAEGAPFIVMERLKGHTLRTEFHELAVVNVHFLIRTMMAVGEALDFAHQHGLVHRDIKPDNIFLAETPDGKVQPKLLDFGIVKLRDYDAHLTQTGMTLGSPAYMAPEQAGGESDVDGRADLWGACVVLFEALTGHLPFQADNYNAILRKILMEPVPDVWQELRAAHVSFNPTLEALANVITRGLRKARDERWQTARDFVGALERCLDPAQDVIEQRISRLELGLNTSQQRLVRSSQDTAVSIPAGSMPRLSRRATWGALAALVLLTGAGLAGWLRRSDAINPTQTTNTATVPMVEPAAIPGSPRSEATNTASAATNSWTAVSHTAASDTAVSHTAPSSQPTAELAAGRPSERTSARNKLRKTQRLATPPASAVDNEKVEAIAPLPADELKQPY
jgi:eukaryotic-like serine/threonine-protein kinase